MPPRTHKCFAVEEGMEDGKTENKGQGRMTTHMRLTFIHHSLASSATLLR